MPKGQVENTERVFIASTYYPPYGSDTRKVTFDWPWKTWACFYNWQKDPPGHYWELESLSPNLPKTTTRLKDIQYCIMPHDADGGYERVWCMITTTQPTGNQLTFQVEQGVLDFLIDFANKYPINRISIKIRRIDNIWQFFESLLGTYEGRIYLKDIKDESG